MYGGALAAAHSKHVASAFCGSRLKVISEQHEFDPSDFTPQRTLARVAELRDHIRDELLPAAHKCADRGLVTSCLRYLDTWACWFSERVEGPLEFLAFTTRNVLEFSLLLPVVFESAETRLNFCNEAFRLDTGDLQQRLLAMFREIGAELPVPPAAEELDWLPESNARLAGKRDVFDAWVHKLCSKLMHPTGIMIIAPLAIADEPKRTTLCFAGLQYLGKSYNYLAALTFETSALE
jgi:hypothetical protein